MPLSFYGYCMAEMRRRVCLWRREVGMVVCIMVSTHLPFFDAAARLVAVVLGLMKVKVVAPSSVAPILVRSRYWDVYIHAG